MTFAAARLSSTRKPSSSARRSAEGVSMEGAAVMRPLYPRSTSKETTARPGPTRPGRRWRRPLREGVLRGDLGLVLVQRLRQVEQPLARTLAQRIEGLDKVVGLL